MNVLQIIVAPALNSKEKIGINGPERRSANLINKWKPFNINPIICYPKWGQLWSIFQQAGVRIIDFDCGPKSNWRAAGAIAAIAKKYKADLIHTQGSPSVDLWASLAGFYSNTPNIVTRPVMIAHYGHYSKAKRYLYGSIDRITLKQTKRIVAVSKDGLDHLRNEMKLAPSKLKLIYNGIKLANFSIREHNSSTGRVNEAPIVLGMVAQLTPQKGWYDFLSVINCLFKKGFNVRGLIVGAGPLWDELHKFVAAKEMLPIIDFKGAQEFVAPYLAQMDIFLFTSHREGLSVAILEAMASGLPIVATDVGGTREQIINGKNGFVVPPGDIDALVFRCMELIREPKSRHVQGLDARVLAEEKFHEDRMLKEYAECYYEVVEEHKTRK